MGIGTSLALIAIGAILAFAIDVRLSGIDITMVGWILILIGLALMAFTLLYTRPRRRARLVEVVDDDPVHMTERVREPRVIIQREPDPVEPQPGTYIEPQHNPRSRQPRDLPP